MSLEVNPSPDVRDAGASEPARPRPQAQTPAVDASVVSNASAALDARPKVQRLAAAVGRDSYQLSSAATSRAIVEDALF